MVRRVAVDAAHIVLPVERIRAIEVSWPGSMAGEAALVYHGRGCAFQLEVEDELLRFGIFRVVFLRFQFCIGVRLARAVAPIAICSGFRSGYLSSAAQLRRVRVSGF